MVRDEVFAWWNKFSIVISTSYSAANITFYYNPTVSYINVKTYMRSRVDTLINKFILDNLNLKKLIPYHKVLVAKAIPLKIHNYKQ